MYAHVVEIELIYYFMRGSYCIVGCCDGEFFFVLKEKRLGGLNSLIAHSSVFFFFFFFINILNEFIINHSYLFRQRCNNVNSRC